jgi:membrane protein DedA with SNARE-associated domain
VIVDEGLWAYPAIFFALVAAGLGFPIPEEIPVVTAGGLCAKAASRPPTDPADWAATLAVPGVEADPILSAAVAAEWARRDAAPHHRRHPFWWIMLPVCIIGVVTCDAFLYGIGRFGGPRLTEHRWFRFLVNPKRLVEIENNFHKYGVRLLLGVRLLPGIRAPVFVAAGVVKLPLHRFLLADGIYALPVISLLFTLAYWFTDSVLTIVRNIERQVGTMKYFVVIAAISALAAWLVYEFWKRRRVTGDPHEVPLIGPKVIKPEHPSPEDQATEQRPEDTQGQTMTMQPVERPRYSLKSYVIAGLMAAIACWAVYETVRRQRNRLD